MSEILPTQITVTNTEAAVAFSFAEMNLGKPYLWAANGPDSFDCSGLIVWSYKQATGRENIFLDGDSIIDDITMNTMFLDNVDLIDDIALVTTGDIIFITNTEGIITHGGLVKEISGNGDVTFINASSYFNKVVLDTWNLHAIIRGQWIVGFGRMKIIAP